MKVIQILPNMNVGGVERGVLDLACYFKDSDLETIVISAGGRLVPELEEHGIKHYTLNVHKKSLSSLFMIPKLRRIIAADNVDIIHARSRVPAWISFFASRKQKADFITTAHGMYKSKFWSEVMGWGKFVICPSRVIARHMKETFGVPQEKIVIIPRWVDLNKLTFTDRTKTKENTTIVSIGRISPSKGYEYLIESFKKVVRFNPLLKLQIIGSADKSKIRYYNYLRSLINRFSLNHNIEFVGFRADVENVLKSAQILVAPSVIEESFGRVIVEAFACGVPVIATKVGGYNEIIEDGKDGLLVEPKSAELIANGIIKLLGDQTLSKTLAQNAYQKVMHRYTMDKCLQEIKKVYTASINLKRILVIKISSLGDLILSFPSLKALKEQLPGSKISVLTSKKYSSLLYGCPYLDDIITVGDTYKKIKDILKISTDLRRKSFDYIIDLQNNRASHLISYLSFPKESFGFSLRWGKLLTKKIKYLRDEGPLDSQERILRLLGVKFQEKKLIFWNSGIKEKHDKIDSSQENFIGINVSASIRWESKRWPASHICNLIDLIYKNLSSTKVILIGDKDALALSESIERCSKHHLLNLCGKTTLAQLPALLKNLGVFITPDTATLHLAEALGVPTIALFGPTDPSRHTVESKNLTVFNKKIDCSFCYKPKCKLSEKNLCMKRISSNEVFKKIEQIYEHSTPNYTSK